MKITGFRLYTIPTGWRNLTYLVLETDEGIEGYGEAHIVGRTHTVREFLRDVRRHIIGYDVFDIESLYERFTLLDFAAPGQIAMTGLALVEMACWDLVGKILGKRCGDLWGGIERERIEFAAYVFYRYASTTEVGDGDRAENAADHADELFDLYGFRDIKFKNGVLTLTVANASADKPADVTASLDGFVAKSVTARILTGATGDYNDFTHTSVAPKAFTGVKLVDGKLTFTLPACSVTEITCL